MNDSSIVQNDQQRSADPRTIHGMINALRITEEPGTETTLFEDDNTEPLLIDEVTHNYAS